MAQADWKPLRAVAAKRQQETRLCAHYAAQWLARAARAYVSARPDDGHTNLGWDGAFGGFTTHPLPDGSRLGLRLGDLTLAILEVHAPAPSLPLGGKTDADVRDWLGGLLRGKGFEPHALDAPSPYEMPAFAIADGARYAVDGEALADLAGWYGNANLVLGEVRKRLIARKFDAPPVRCWPHHFDLDTLIYFHCDEPVRTMGVGFSPGDEYYDEPYFYVSMHPAPDVAMLPPLPMIAHWHAQDFTAVIAPASRIVASRDQRAEVDSYLEAAIEAATAALSQADLTSNTAR
jgi:hypothetical protein